MNWKLKAHALALASRIPGGRGIYHRVQRLAGTNRLNVKESLRRCFEIVELVRLAGRDLEGARVVEIGTGWRPFLPFVLHLAGTRRVVTFDVNPWLTHRYARETCDALGSQLPHIAEHLGQDVERVRERYDAARREKRTLDSLLAGFGIEYRCPGDARATALAANSVDITCSTNVLEHIPPEVLREIHAESYRILIPGGLSVHRIDPGDHFRLVDSSITGANFLQFSVAEWHWYGGSGLSYHNRLRCAQQQQLVEEAGFRVPIARIRPDERAERAIRSGELSIHPDFGRFTPEELSADYISLVGVKPAATAASVPRAADPEPTMPS